MLEPEHCWEGKTRESDNKWKSPKNAQGDKIIYSFNKYLLGPYYVAGTMDTKLKKYSPCPQVQTGLMLQSENQSKTEIER